MTFHSARTARAAVLLTAAGIVIFAVCGCGKAPDPVRVSPAAEADGATAAAQSSSSCDQAAASPAPQARLFVAAPTDVKAPPPGTAVSQDPNAAAEAIADNAKVADLSKQFEADPAAVVRQNTACGSADQVVNNLYALSHGAETDALHRFRLACMAKDSAQREIARKAATAGGVKNTNSL